LLTGVWAVTVLGFFSASFSKLEHYFLPAIPPLSLMVGALWAESFTDGRRGATRPNLVERLLGLRWNLGIAALGCVIVGVAIVVFGDRLTSQALLAGFAELNVYYRILEAQGWELPFSVTPFIPLVKGLGMVLILGISGAFIFYCFHLPRFSFVWFLAVAGAIAVLVFKLDLLVEPHHSTKAVAHALKQRANDGDPIIHEGSLEYSGGLPFYTGRQIRVLNGRRGDLEFGSRDPEARGLFLNDKELARLWNSGQRVFLVTRFDRERSVVRSLPEKSVFLLGRYGSRSLFSNAPATKNS
jgi:4-amino-4-deoxy-L-arabinose transferase-like glycosyltransferase